MEVFNGMEKYGYEQVVFCYNRPAGLKAIIAIHNTTLGPALGGLRMWPYESEADALFDVLRLSRGMTYKAAAAGLNLGGGKAVIIGDPKRDKSEALFRAFGRFVQSLGGRYITAEDVGTSVEDMDYVHMETDYVTGVSTAFGSSGDPSPATAFGVWRGMKAAANGALNLSIPDGWWEAPADAADRAIDPERRRSGLCQFQHSRRRDRIAHRPARRVPGDEPPHCPSGTSSGASGRRQLRLRRQARACQGAGHSARCGSRPGGDDRWLASDGRGRWVDGRRARGASAP